MGNTAREFTAVGPDDESEDERPPLGDLLAGRFSELDVDSVEAVRRLREDR